MSVFTIPGLDTEWCANDESGVETSTSRLERFEKIRL